MLRKSNFASLRVRLTLWYVLLLALVLTGFSGLIYLFLDQRLDQQADDQLRAVGRQAAESLVLTSDNQPQILQTGGDSDLKALGEQGYLVRVINLDGTILANLGPLSQLAIPAQLVTNIISTRQPQFVEVKTASPESPVRLYGVPLLKDDQLYGVVVVGQSLRTIQDTLHLLLLILALVLPVTLLGTSAGGLFLANRALKPIDRITRTVQRINAEDLTRRVGVPAKLPGREDEVDRLAKTFDAMLERLEEAFNRQRQFTADASHELRTPLAIMKGNIGVALNRLRPADEYQAVLVEVEEEVDRLTRLVHDLLLLARADSIQPLLQTERLDIGDVLSVVVEQIRPLAEAKEIQLHLEVACRLELEGDLSKLLRLFLNLVDNAIKYTSPGGQVKVWSEFLDQNFLKVTVADTGCGIAPEHLAHIFERFYRADEARTRSAGGTGLGLTLAKWIATAHGGRIEATSIPGKGSTFMVFLPLSPSFTS